MARSCVFAVTFSFALLATGCTLLNLDDLEPANCSVEAVARGYDRDEICALALNERNGFPSAEDCRPYRCNVDTGECELATDAERCDAYDNDCDGLVDEGLATSFNPQAAIEDPATFRTEHQGAGLTSLSVVPSLASTAVTYSDADDKAWFFNFGDGIGLAPSPLTYQTGAEDEPDMAEAGCWTRAYPGAGAGMVGDAPIYAKSNCDFAALASDRLQGVGLVAAINTQGCIDGQLRIGHTSAEDTGSFQVNGPIERSNSFVGVGLTSDARCTATDTAACDAARREEAVRDICEPGCGADEVCFDGVCVMPTAGVGGLAACESDGQCAGGKCLCGRCISPSDFERARACGLTGVAIDASRTLVGSSQENTGIVAFTSGSAEYACRAPFERDVAIIGAGQVSAAGDFSRDFVSTTGEGTPRVLGRTRAAAAPAVYGLEDQFVVAYPSVDDDALVIHTIAGLPRLAAQQPDFSSTRCEAIAGETLDCDVAGSTPVCGETLCGSDVGACVSGSPSCVLGRAVCDGVVQPTAEICGSGVDEDCDGLIDEDPALRPCLATCVPVPETCNAADDDCDGLVDEGVGGAVCGTAPPIAASACVQGTEVCRGGEILCEGAIDPMLDASSNGLEYAGSVTATADFPYGAGIDDDCDGRVDEGSVVTSCAGTGMTETCNGLDDDRDCAIDEGTPNLRADQLLYAPESQRPAEVVRQCLAEPGFGDLPPMNVEGALGFGAMDDISIAGTPFRRGDEIAIGVAWREADPSAPASYQIGFRVLRFETECECTVCADPDMEACDPSTLTCDDDRCMGTVLRNIRYVGATDPTPITTEPGIYGPPHVSYKPRGVVLPGTQRSGREVLRDGGFEVVYQARDVPNGVARILTRTLTEHDGLPLEPGCPADCSADITVIGIAGDGRDVPNVAFPRSFFDETKQETRYLYYDAANREFISYGYVCERE